MQTYFLGMTIDSLSLVMILGYMAYSEFTGNKYMSRFEKRALIIVGTVIFLVIVVSGFLVWYGNLQPATILVWMSAVPLLVTAVFILLIILFKPGWR
jgi:hypothetical protein